MRASYTLFWSSVLWTDRSLREFDNTCLVHTSALVSLLASARRCSFSGLRLTYHLRMCSKELHLEMLQPALLLYSPRGEKCSGLACSAGWQGRGVPLLLLPIDVLYQLRGEKCLSLTCSLGSQDRGMPSLLLPVETLFPLQDQLQIVLWLN